MMLLKAASLLLAFTASLSHAAAVDERSLASDILADIESATTCAACEVCKISISFRSKTTIEAKTITRPLL